MKKYFYLKNGQQIGPFSYDELWQQKISADTMVWCEGMQNWQRAASIQEFGNWFAQKQPAQPRQQVKRPQVQQRTQQVQRPAPVKKRKSYRGMIGVAIFLIGCAVIYWYWAESTGNTRAQIDKVVTKSRASKSKSKNLAVSIPELGDENKYTRENFPLNPTGFGNEIGLFLGSIRTSVSEAKLNFMDPLAEERYDYIEDTYTKTALQIFFQGVVPSVYYQSVTSALVVFYNPWNDLVFITDWHLIEGQLIIIDMELVSADYLQFDGIGIGQLSPLWARNTEMLPIDALTEQVEERHGLFRAIWGELTGTNTWRKVLYSLSSPEQLLLHQPVVAFRLRDQFLNMQDLIRGKELKVLRDPFVRDMKLLHSADGIEQLLNAGAETPDVVFENMSLYPPETWEKASVQAIQRVPEGAFVFVTSPRLTKTYLSFFYKFGPNENLALNRIDWCTFDNEL